MADDRTKESLRFFGVDPNRLRVIRTEGKAATVGSDQKFSSGIQLGAKQKRA